MTAVELDTAWDLHPRVSVRPEEFGALLYHFETRQLSFLKERKLLEIVESLATHATVRSACQSVGVAEADFGRYLPALDRLAQTQMLVERKQ